MEERERGEDTLDPMVGTSQMFQCKEGRGAWFYLACPPAPSVLWFSLSSHPILLLPPFWSVPHTLLHPFFLSFSCHRVHCHFSIVDTLSVLRLIFLTCIACSSPLLSLQRERASQVPWPVLLDVGLWLTSGSGGKVSLTPPVTQGSDKGSWPCSPCACGFTCFCSYLQLSSFPVENRGRELGPEGVNGMESERDFFPASSQEGMIQSANLRER